MSAGWAAVERGAPDYPAALERLGSAAPAVLTVWGAPAALRVPALALFCSVRAPAACALAAYDVAAALRDAGTAVAGGFQSPIERECLEVLLRGDGPLVVFPARALEGARLPASWRAALESGRLTLVSAFTPPARRPTAAMAALRNRVVGSLAAAAVVLHATPGGRLCRLAGELAREGRPVHCLDLPENADLRLAGATPGSAAEIAARGVGPAEARR